MVLLEYLEHLVLPNERSEPRRILLGRDAQQHSIKVILQSEEINLSGSGEHRTIIIVAIAINVVVGGIEPARALQQLDLGVGVRCRKHADSLLGSSLMPVDGQVGIDNLLHALPQVADIVGRDIAALALVVLDGKVDVIAVGHGDVDDDGAARPQVACCLAEHEEQAASVGSHGGCIVQIEELDVLRLIHTVVHPFHPVVHACTNRSIVHFETRERKNFRKCGSDADI